MAIYERSWTTCAGPDRAHPTRLGYKPGAYAGAGEGGDQVVRQMRVAMRPVVVLRR